MDFKEIFKNSRFNKNKHYNFIFSDSTKFLSFDTVNIFFKISNSFLNTFSCIHNTDWYRSAILRKFQLPNNLLYIVDGSQFTNNIDDVIVMYNYNSMLSDENFVFYTEISNDFFALKSLNSLFKSTVWLERELSDFTNLSFLQTKDSRRLLIDYTEVRSDFSTHTENFKAYTNIYYDILIPTSDLMC